MNIGLFFRALTRVILGIVLVGIFVFVPAGTIDFPLGWNFMVVLFVPMIIAGIVMMVLNPRLLSLRLDAKEKESDQRWVILLSGVMFILGFVASGLDFRFGWTDLPSWVMIVATIIFIISYVLYGEVLRENTYLSRSIRVHEGQRVIDKGLYSIVRHPMYSATILLFLSIPLMLGSLFAFLIFLVYPFVIAKRIKGEEALLEKELDGYIQYKQRVKYRLIPYLW